MTITPLLIVAGFLGASVLVPSIAGAASAEGGRITFSGAVVAPTCGVSSPVITMVAAVPHAVTETQRLTCATSGNAGSAASRIYALTVVHLSSSVPDRVLKYFDAYVKAGRPDAADPILLTQVYE